MRQLSIPALLVGTGLTFNASTVAAWVPGGTPVTITWPGQRNPEIVSDGAAGAIIAWSHNVGNPFNHIYAQRLDDTGVRAWGPNGVRVCDVDSTHQEYPHLVADGAGGAIIAWGDQRGANYDLYAQKLDSAGNRLWNANGVVVCTAPNKQDLYHRTQLWSDGAGGAIITWEDARGANWDIYIQRIDATGTALGIANGNPVCTATGDQKHPGLTTDGAGGAIVVWEDARRGANRRDLYAQRVDATMTPLWAADGVLLSAWSPASTVHAQPVSDGAGGAIVTWDDDRGAGSHIYARRIGADGTPMWATDGVPVALVVGYQYDPRIASDNAGGAIITWQDNRNGNFDIYAQRIDATGTLSWIPDGVALCENDSAQVTPQIVGDGAGGAIIVWEDSRSGDVDIYGRRIDANGVPLSTPDGFAVCVDAFNQNVPQLISDGSEGAIVTWADMRRNGYTPDVYAHLIAETANAVAISSFDATARNGIVTLTAAFHTDRGIATVDVYRSTRGTGLRLIARVEDVASGHFEYIDQDVAPGQTYRYQIGVTDADGMFLSPFAEVTMAALTARLAQNRPNPFNPTTTIEYTLSERSPVVLHIHNAAGALVARLDQGIQDAGTHAVTWDGRNAQGGAVVSGVYFYSMEGMERAGSKKMVLLK